MLSEPEDYGLDGDQTLEHRVDPARPEGFDAHWSEVRDAIAAMPDRLVGAAGPGTYEISMRSLGDVRIAGWLHRPARPVHGAALLVHGHRIDPEWEERTTDALTARGVAVLRLRLRGFGPSAIDVEELRDEWILHRISSPQDWVVRGAVVDVATAYRALRRHFGPGVPVAIVGRALGGGLAVIAAAQMTRLGDPPARLVASLPDLAGWTWRATRFCSGPGALVNMIIESWREDGPLLLRGLALYDAALHAADVTAPALFHLARRDDVVPAPAAAAIANAWSGAPSWRFVTRYGHYDGGLANARRAARLPEITQEFLDPTREPGQSEDPLRDRLAK